jgi:hypothetical protein
MQVEKRENNWYFLAPRTVVPPRRSLAMKSEIRVVTAVFLAFILALYPISAFAAAPIRHASDIGATGNADFWNLFGPTQAAALTSTTKITQEVLCPNLTVASANGDEKNAGGCTGGVYLFLIQIQSTKTAGLLVDVKDLVGFTFVEDSNNPDGSTVGLVQCDSGNTVGLCTTLGSGAASQFPNVTFTHSTDNTVVNVHIPPSLPAYPAGTGTQGQGLTVFVKTKQTPAVPAVPVAFPKITGG